MILQSLSPTTGYYISKFFLNLIAPFYAITIIVSTFLVPYYLLKFLVEAIKKYKNKNNPISLENENLILCKKCSVNLCENILCENCSDEVLTLFLIDELPAEEIEQSFNFLPNTVEYWYNTCKSQNNGDFSYLTTAKYNQNYIFSNKQHILKRLLAFLIDIFFFEVVVIFFCMTFS